MPAHTPLNTELRTQILPTTYFKNGPEKLDQRWSDFGARKYVQTYVQKLTHNKYLKNKNEFDKTYGTTKQTIPHEITQKNPQNISDI